MQFKYCILSPGILFLPLQTCGFHMTASGSSFAVPITHFSANAVMFLPLHVRRSEENSKRRCNLMNFFFARMRCVTDNSSLDFGVGEDHDSVPWVLKRNDHFEIGRIVRMLSCVYTGWSALTPVLRSVVTSRVVYTLRSLRYCCNNRCDNELSFVYTLGTCCNNWYDNRSSHRTRNPSLTCQSLLSLQGTPIACTCLPNRR